MKKPNQLRKILEQSHPDFVKNPDHLQLYVDGGQIVSTGAASFSFEYRYTLNVVVTDYAGDIATLIVPMMAYLRTNQPEILENPQIRENAFKFRWITTITTPQILVSKSNSLNVSCRKKTGITCRSIMQKNPYGMNQTE